MLWVILELASYLSKQKKYSFLSPLLVAAVVGLVRLWRNLCASGVTCPPVADRLTNNQVKFLPLLAERISVSVSAYGGTCPPMADGV